MVKHYKETPWYWYGFVLVFSFILGIIVVTKENVTLPVWAYIVSLIVGIIIAPFVSIYPHTTTPPSNSHSPQSSTPATAMVSQPTTSPS